MKIFCIGWNYPLHNSEMGNVIKPERPTIFMKPDTAILRENRPFFIPAFSNRIEHEVELVVKINRIGKDIEPRFAHRYYSEIALGIDFTARDIQTECKKMGAPWEIAKSFDHSAAISRFISLDAIQKDISNIQFNLYKNNTLQQEGNSAQMLFNVDTIISYISQYFTLKIGDLIYTGTPAGVSKVEINDHLEGYIENIKLLDFYIK